MAMSGYFTEGKPSPGVYTPPTLSDHDQDSLSKEPLELSPGKTYNAIKDKTDGKPYFNLLLCHFNGSLKQA